MQNAESKMRNRKCGVTLIGQRVKSRDRRHSTDYRNDVASGRAVKCIPAMRKMQAMMQQCIFCDQHTHSKQNNLPLLTLS